MSSLNIFQKRISLNAGNEISVRSEGKLLNEVCLLTK